ncbi:hypothetical protein [Lyngbya sp. CCY1209]|jgi:hypothetical protein|uniref:hypothetical protein n=1 Tax=Lyngbya sp. CCY1209 TaxID=2886103 RepID=UPI002D1FC80A|nr:hypothetical protein [Lyngbya sp. CCY1209]MEB3884580.1 hypothetical protein [Lyngbya sp. CCY1209]
MPTILRGLIAFEKSMQILAIVAVMLLCGYLGWENVRESGDRVSEGDRISAIYS